MRMEKVDGTLVGSRGRRIGMGMGGETLVMEAA